MSRVTMCDVCNKIIPKQDDFFEPTYSSRISLGEVMGARFELCETCTKPIRATLDGYGLNTKNPTEDAIEHPTFEDDCDEE